MRKRYLFDDPRLGGLKNFSRFHGAMRALTFSDDPWATRPSAASDFAMAAPIPASAPFAHPTPAASGIAPILRSPK